MARLVERLRGPGTPVERLAGVAAVAAVAVLLVAVVQIVRYQVAAIAFPYPLDYGEGPLLDQARRILAGQPLYPVPGSAPPWTVSNYPPLFPLVEAAFGAVAGPAYWYGRLVSALAVGVAGLSAGMTVARLAKDRLAGLLTGLLVVAVPYVGHWSGLARIDCLALGLSLAGLAVLVSTQGDGDGTAGSARSAGSAGSDGDDRRTRRAPRLAGLLVAVLLLVAAAWTRQTYALAAPLAGLVWLARTHGRRPAAGFAGLGAVGLLLPGVLLDLGTDGGFWFNVVTANVNSFRPEVVATFAVEILSRLPILVGAAVAGLLLTAVSRWVGPGLPGAWLAVPYLAGGVVTAATIGKIGSNINYLLELCGALCVMTGLLVASARRSPVLRAGLLGLVVVQGALWVLAWPSYAYLARATADRDTPERLLQLVRDADGPVLGDEVMGLLPLAGRPIEFQPFELTQLARDGLWDQQPLIGELYARRYAVVTIYTLPNYPIEQERWTEEMLAAITTAYTPVVEIGRGGAYTVVYEPTG